MIIDPEIKVTTAIAAYSGSQSKLARALGVERSSVNEWVSSGRTNIPTLQAYRLIAIDPATFGE